ncbi:hypothetical protein TNCV_2272761, partial [Trichonephila clavipes]
MVKLLAVKCKGNAEKAIWAVWGHSCSTDDEPIHWFCPTNPNTWLEGKSVTTALKIPKNLVADVSDQRDAINTQQGNGRTCLQVRG